MLARDLRLRDNLLSTTTGELICLVLKLFLKLLAVALGVKMFKNGVNPRAIRVLINPSEFLFIIKTSKYQQQTKKEGIVVKNDGRLRIP